MQPLQIDPQQLAERLRSPAPPLVVDVRQPQELQAEGFIEDSLHIPMADVPARLAEIPEDREVVFVCKRGQRSFNVAQWLRQHGRDASSMAGGLDAWRALGLPVRR